jgi:CheY-like chemotaxis protein
MKEIDYWKAEIKDTGVGISKENIAKIFNPFFTTKENGKGTGLGLSMVYNIIKQHEGHINVYSEQGKGTVFNVYLPVPEEEVTGKTESCDKPSILKTGRNGLILIIDDDESVSKTVKTMLEKSGYKTFTSGDCISGIDYFKNNFNEITAVILDFSMPRFTGKEVFLELVKIDPSVKVMLTSGFGLDDRTIPLLEMGVKGFLKKPFTLDQLLESIDSILS